MKHPFPPTRAAFYLLALLIAVSIASSAAPNRTNLLASYTFPSPTEATSTSHVFQGYRRLDSLDLAKLEQALSQPAHILAVDNHDALLSATDLGVDTRVVYLRGYRSAGDGGQGYFVVNRSTANHPPDGLVTVRPPGARYILERLHAGSLNIRASGARGDGITDDTVTIQRVLDTKLNVYADGPGYTFLVGYVKALLPPSTPYRAALVLASGQTLDLGNSRLKLRRGANSSLIANKALLSRDATQTLHLQLRNVVIDGNSAEQKVTHVTTGDVFSPAIYLANIRHAVIKGVRVENYYSAGLYITERNGGQTDDVVLDDITVTGGFGPGVAVWGNHYKIGRIHIENTAPFTEDGKAVHYWGAYPNSMTAQLSNSTVTDISFKNCSWGFKLQDGSKNVEIHRIVAEGVLDGQAIKFQGIDDQRGYQPNQDIRVDEVIARSNRYNGLYVIYNHGLRISRYTGQDNGVAYRQELDRRQLDTKNFYDVLIIKSDAVIDEIRSLGSTAGVLYSHEEGTRASAPRHFGKIAVHSSNASNPIYLRGSSNTIGEITVSATAGPLNSVVYYDDATSKTGRSSSVESIKLFDGLGILKHKSNVCRGQGTFECSRIEARDSPAYRIVNGISEVLN